MVLAADGSSLEGTFVWAWIHGKIYSSSCSSPKSCVLYHSLVDKIAQSYEIKLPTPSHKLKYFHLKINLIGFKFPQCL